MTTKMTGGNRVPHTMLVAIAMLGCRPQRPQTVTDLTFVIPANTWGYFVVPYTKGGANSARTIKVPMDGVCEAIPDGAMSFSSARYSDGASIQLSESLADKPAIPAPVQLQTIQDRMPGWPDATMFFLGTEKQFRASFADRKLGLISAQQAGSAGKPPKAVASKNFTFTFYHTAGQSGGKFVLRNISNQTLYACELVSPVCLKLISKKEGFRKVPIGHIMPNRFTKVQPGGTFEANINLADFVDARAVEGTGWVRILYDDSFANDYYASDAPHPLSQVGQVTSEPFLVHVVNGRCVIQALPTKQR